jgi:hypothetical protein
MIQDPSGGHLLDQIYAQSHATITLLSELFGKKSWKQWPRLNHQQDRIVEQMCHGLSVPK